MNKNRYLYRISFSIHLLSLFICVLFLPSSQAAAQTVSFTPSVSPAPSIPARLTLEQARQLARVHNRDLQTLRLNLRIAQEKTMEARSKAFPQLSSQADYTVHDKPMSPGGDMEYWGAGLTLSQTLFHLGIWAGIRAARHYQEMEELAAQRYEQTLDFLTTDAYLGILRSQKEISVLKELEKNTQDHLRDTRNFYTEGMVPKTDLLKTELALSQVQRDLLASENGQQKAWTTFKILLGVDLDRAYDLEDVELAQSSLKELKELQMEALTRRNDYKKMLAERSFLKNTLTAYKSKHYPVISAFGSMSYTTSESEYQDRSMTGGVRVTLPLFTGFETNAQIAQGRSQLVQNQIRVQAITDQIRQEVESAYLDILKARLDFETAQKEVTEAEENLRINNDLYKESMATNTDVLDAQTLLAQARNHLNNARYDQILAGQRLSLATGGL
ncbi:MAG: TolC family protein [bacterium]